MKMRNIVIIHGWSDDNTSFENLGQFIKQSLGVQPIVIDLARWISMQDEVTLPDIAFSMQRAWAAHALPNTPRSVDVIVHSTGALVIRHWMTQYFDPETVPVMRLLMLAPANFGSPLARKGRSFIGRAIKGWDQPGFQTGTQILKALDIASPYSFYLAQKDLFNPNHTWYGAGKILATVLVGDTGYSGVSAIANEDGGDGTIRISTANLNAGLYRLVLNSEQKLIDAQYQETNGNVAFGIIPKENHSTIAFKDSGPRNSITRNLILMALDVADDSFSVTGGASSWQKKLTDLTRGGGDKVRFQNTVFSLRDNMGQKILEYFVELYRTGKPDDNFEKRLYEKVIASVDTYKDDPSFRSLYIDINEFEKLKPSITDRGFLYLSFSAHPIYNPPLHPVGYKLIESTDTGGFEMNSSVLEEAFQAHRTLLVDVEIQRTVDEAVFQFPESYKL